MTLETITEWLRAVADRPELREVALRELAKACELYKPQTRVEVFALHEVLELARARVESGELTRTPMSFRFRRESITPSHVTVRVFANGAHAGLLTMRIGELEELERRAIGAGGAA